MEPLVGNTEDTLGSESVYTKQQGIAQLAERMPDAVLTTLSYHVDMDWLREAYRRTRKDGAAGVDEVTAAEYERDLETNLGSLLERFKSGSYRAAAVRRVYIPKEAEGKAKRAVMGMGGQCWVLEVDIRSYFDTVSHEHVREFVGKRVRDGVINRMVGKWLKAGVMEDGQMHYPQRGTPQG